MATYKKNYNTVAKTANKAVSGYNNTIDKSTNQQVAASNQAYDTNIAQQKTETAGQVKQLDTAYQSQYDAAAINAELSRRQIQNSMANAGLKNSGLNAMQQTAVSVAQNNANTQIGMQKTAARASLESQLQQYIQQQQSEKAQSAANLRASGEQTKAAAALSMKQQALSDASALTQLDRSNAASLKQQKLDIASNERMNAANIKQEKWKTKYTGVNDYAAAVEKSAISTLEKGIKNKLSQAKINGDSAKEEVFKYIKEMAKDATYSPYIDVALNMAGYSREEYDKISPSL